MIIFCAICLSICVYFLLYSSRAFSSFNTRNSNTYHHHMLYLLFVLEIPMCKAIESFRVLSKHKNSIVEWICSAEHFTWIAFDGIVYIFLRKSEIPWKAGHRMMYELITNDSVFQEQTPMKKNFVIRNVFFLFQRNVIKCNEITAKKHAQSYFQRFLSLLVFIQATTLTIFMCTVVFHFVSIKLPYYRHFERHKYQRYTWTRLLI